MSLAGSNAGADEDTDVLTDVWNALADVSDPCHALCGHGLSILDLGLVNRVTRVGNEIEIGVTLTEVSCTFGYRIIEDIEALAEDFPEVDRFRVVIEPYPLWTPARLSERARAHYRDMRSRFGPGAVKSSPEHR